MPACVFVIRTAATTLSRVCVAADRVSGLSCCAQKRILSITVSQSTVKKHLRSHAQPYLLSTPVQVPRQRTQTRLHGRPSIATRRAGLSAGAGCHVASSPPQRADRSVSACRHVCTHACTCRLAFPAALLEGSQRRWRCQAGSRQVRDANHQELRPQPRPPAEYVAIARCRHNDGT